MDPDWRHVRERRIRLSGDVVVFFPGWLAPARRLGRSVAVYEWQSGSSSWTQIGDNFNLPSTARLFQAMATWLRSASSIQPGQNRFGPPACSTTQAALGNRSVPISSGLRPRALLSKVSISSDGKVLAVGTRDSSDASGVNATQSGRVRIYQWPSNDLAASDTWTQMGETIEAWKTSEGSYGSEMEPFSIRSIWMRVRCPATATRVVVFRDDNDVGTVTSTSGNHRRGPWSETR